MPSKAAISLLQWTISTDMPIHSRSRLIPSAIAAIGIGARMIFQSKQTDKIMKFEETNTWASSGGRAVTGSLRDEFKLH